MTDKNMHANPSKNRTPRHRAREFALQGLYQWLLNNEPARIVAANIRSAHGFDKADSDFFSALLNGAISTSVELRESIAPLIDRSIAELSPIARAEQVTTPTLVLHGELDETCLSAQAREWYSALR
ncbi:MAG: transcription antitermination factor NusB, partial [Massilia sp.]